MESTNYDLLVGSFIAAFLRKIPSDLEPPKTIDEIAEGLRYDQLEANQAHGIAIAMVSVLKCFGVLEWHENKIRAKSQMPTYFLQSLSWYFDNRVTIFTDWARTGTAREIALTNLLDASPYFLKVMEERRLRVAREENIESGHSRSQPVATLLIKTIQASKQCFLHQWDTKAEQYQLIGGKVRPTESPVEAARRELREEISEHDLVHERDYELTPLNDSPIKLKDVSRTYGALTAYEFWLFSVTLKIPIIKQADIDRWISLDEMNVGSTDAGRKIADPALYRKFNAKIPNGFEGLSVSIETKRKNFCESLKESLEVKAGYGILKINLKKLAKSLLGR